jgi:hypothetical protein
VWSDQNSADERRSQRAPSRPLIVLPANIERY